MSALASSSSIFSPRPARSPRPCHKQPRQPRLRELTPGPGYAVRLAAAREEITDQLEVMSGEGSQPDESFYANQVLEPGFGYLTTRDGTKLSIFVWMPGPPEDEAEPPLRAIFESGAASGITAGAPQGTFEQRFDAWPIPGTRAQRWYLQPGGGLAETPPGPDGGSSSFEHDPLEGDRTTRAGGSIDMPQPEYGYRPLAAGKAVAIISEPLEGDLVMLGHGSVDLWLKSTAGDADLEVNLTEDRPDDLESYVQSGWLRAAQRALRDDATELRPVKTHREEDAALLDADAWNQVRVELMPFGHVFRAGSRIRISVDTPGASRWDWRSVLLEHDQPPTHTIAHQQGYPSSVVLPVIPGVEVPTALPPCHALRGQRCRTYEPLPE